MDNTFAVEYGIKGEERKRLVKAIAEYKETFSEYCGAPTFAYTVDEITIDKEGNLIFAEEPEAEELSELTAYLEAKGFTPGGKAEAPETTAGEETAEEEQPEEEQPEAEEEEAEPSDRLTISVPREGFTDEALSNLQKMIDSKASLLKKSLGTEDLSIEITEDKVSFPWFTQMDETTVGVYTRLIGAICEAAKKAKRVTATDHAVDSEKYAFRTWLLRLGFVGAEYKNDRAILMKNLSGTAAFKNDADAKAFAERQKAKREAVRAAAAAADFEGADEEKEDDEISE